MTLDPLRESGVISCGTTRARLELSPIPDKSSSKAFYHAKNRKNLLNENREEYIKQTVHSYFN